jgi:hypothetical protein
LAGPRRRDRRLALRRGARQRDLPAVAYGAAFALLRGGGEQDAVGGPHHHPPRDALAVLAGVDRHAGRSARLDEQRREVVVGRLPFGHLVRQLHLLHLLRRWRRWRLWRLLRRLLRRPLMRLLRLRVERLDGREEQLVARADELRHRLGGVDSRRDHERMAQLALCHL